MTLGFISLVRSCSISLVTLAEHKLLLLNKDRLQGVLRVDAVDGGFDEAKDMCDHFASNPSNLGRTSTGISKIFLKYFSRGLFGTPSLHGCACYKKNAVSSVS